MKDIITVKNDIEAVENLRKAYVKLNEEIAKVIVGQKKVIEEVIISLFSKGHCLLIGVPGLAKTLLITTIAKALGLKYNRIQFTPDLMPSDIIGSEILDEERKFKFIKGPIFCNFLLADEINRTPPKTQSALLEAMQEKTVTAAGKQFKLEEPFFVLATQNPIEQEGTYPLPEAQLDRFMFNILLDYPSIDEEITIVEQTTSARNVTIEQVLDAEEIIFYQNLIYRIPVNRNVISYAVNLVYSTRPGRKESNSIANKYVTWGCSPRASQFLIIAAKTYAALHGKYSPDIEDVKAVAHPVMRHRLIKNYQAEAEGITNDMLIDEFIKLLE
ncbi:MAG: AAA family ATPase [Bacteroidales bacterium]|nr:AAA family ATPase [Bacteroidales bacterium]